MQISCNSNKVASPNCKCAYPYKGTKFFRGLASFDLKNKTYYKELEKSLMKTLQSSALPVDSVSLSNPTMDSSGNIELSLEVFPSGQECFNQTAITMVGFALNNLSFYPPPSFGPFYLMAFTYGNCAAGNSEFHGELESNSYFVFSMLFGCYCNFIMMHLSLSLSHHWGTYSIEQIIKHKQWHYNWSSSWWVCPFVIGSPCSSLCFPPKENSRKS